MIKVTQHTFLTGTEGGIVVCYPGIYPPGSVHVLGENGKNHISTIRWLLVDIEKSIPPSSLKWLMYKAYSKRNI